MFHCCNGMSGRQLLSLLRRPSNGLCRSRAWLLRVRSASMHCVLARPAASERCAAASQCGAAPGSAVVDVKRLLRAFEHVPAQQRSS